MLLPFTATESESVGGVEFHGRWGETKSGVPGTLRKKQKAKVQHKRKQEMEIAFFPFMEENKTKTWGGGGRIGRVGGKRETNSAPPPLLLCM